MTDDIVIITFIISSIILILSLWYTLTYNDRYGYTGREGYKKECTTNHWFYNHAKSQCNELGVYND